MAEPNQTNHAAFEQEFEPVKPVDPMIGQVLNGEYLVLDRLGAGGMAIVYRCKALKFDRIVALKTLKEKSQTVMDRFYREMQTLSKLKHRNIVQALDCIQTSSGETFLVMEYVEGFVLEELIKTQGRIEKAEDIAAIITQICDALEHAHAQKIIHRDLKPANVIMTVDDETGELVIKVLDFGIAKLQDDMQKLTTEGQAMGSPLYMSPEQCMGKELSPASDVYSLGALSYELLTGKVPYQSAKMMQVMASHCNPEVFPVPISTIRQDLGYIEQLNQIIFRTLETPPEKRFQSASDLGKAVNFWIQSVRKGESIPLPKELQAATAINKAKNAKTVQASTQFREGIKRKQQGTTNKQQPGQPSAAKALVMIGMFVVLAIGLTAGLAFFLINNLDTLNAKWLEASRALSGTVTVKKQPEKPKEEVTKTETQPNSNDTTGGGVEIGGDATQQPTVQSREPVAVQQSEQADRPRRLQSPMYQTEQQNDDVILNPEEYSSEARERHADEHR